MCGPRVWEDFNIGFAARGSCVIAISILDIHPAVTLGNPIPGPGFLERLGCVVFSLNRNDPVGLVVVAAPS